MPSESPFENPKLSPRLAPYRYRAAEIRTASGLLGVAFIEPVVKRRETGRLWWKRLEPAEVHVHLWVDYPGHELSSYWVVSDDVEVEVDLWDAGRSIYIPGDGFLVWVEDPDTTEQIKKRFGITT